MATLPVYRRQISPSSAAMPVGNAGELGTTRGVDAIAQGANALVSAAQRADQMNNRNAALLNDAMQRKLTEDAHAWTANALSNDHIAWSDWMAKAREEAPPGAPNFAGDFLKTFDAQTENALKAAPDDQSKRFYEQRRVALRASLFESARTFEAQQSIKYREQQWDDSISNVERIAARDPEQGKVSMAEQEAILRASPNQALARIKIAKMRETVAKSAVQGMVERNPELALRTLDAYFNVQSMPVQPTAPDGQVFAPPDAGYAGGPEFAALSAKLAAKSTFDDRLKILRAEAEDPRYDQKTRDGIRREIAAVEKQAAKAPAVALPSAEPPPLKDGKPASGNWAVDSLDPQTAWTMRNRAQADVRRLQAQAAAQAADRDRLVAAQAKSVSDMMNDGYTPNPQLLSDIKAAAAGTQYAGMLADAEQRLAVTSGFRVMSDAQRTAVLDQSRARGNAQQWTPAERSTYEALTTLDGKIRQAYRDEPLRAGVMQGVLPALAPLDTTSLQTVVASLLGRVQQAKAVSARTGTPVSPFTSEEADGIASQLATLAPREQSVAIANLSRMTGPQGQAIAAQLDKKDKSLALAFALGTQMTGGSTDSLHTPPRFVAEMVLKGARAEKDGTSTKNEKVPGVKAAQWKATITTALDGVLPSQDMGDKVRDAALYIAHGIASEQGGELSKDDLERAARLAVGGNIVEHNGRKVALPGGTDASWLEDKLRKVTPADFQTQAPDGKVIAGGQTIDSEEFVKTLPGQQLLSVRPGQYAVIVGGRPVLTSSGRPLILGMQ